MAYSAVNARRIAYESDGTVVGTSGSDKAITMFLDSGQISNLNSLSGADIGRVTPSSGYIMFFFPEKRIINALFIGGYSEYINGQYNLGAIQGSADTTNGVDGTWIDAEYSIPPITANPGRIDWRTKYQNISFSSPIRVLRISTWGEYGYWQHHQYIHIYGHKAVGETPDDIIFCTSDGTELTSLKDWGDTERGVSSIAPIYLKNVSTKQANTISIVLNDADFTISTDQVTWGTTVNIASMVAGAISVPIYVRQSPSTSQLLGPRAAKIVVTTSSWT